MINLKDYYNEGCIVPLQICKGDVSREEWVRKHDRLMSRYPDYPRPTTVECVDFVIEKKLAERIKEGGVPVWFIFDKENTIVERLCSAEALDYSEHKTCVENDTYWMKNHPYTDPGNIIKTLCFHDEDNTWQVTVECKYWNGEYLALDEEELEFFENNFNSTYLRRLKVWMDETTDRQLDEYADGLIKDEDMFDYVPDRAWRYFVLGKVISTNL